MKKNAILFLLLSVMLLSSCAGPANTNKSDTIYIDITQNTTSDVSGIHYEYYLEKTPAGGAEIRNADYSTISKGDSLTAQFIDKDFPDDSDLSQFAIEFFIMNNDGSEDPVANRISFDAKYGNRYSIIISGNKKEGYEAMYSQQ